VGRDDGTPRCLKLEPTSGRKAPIPPDQMQYLIGRGMWGSWFHRLAYLVVLGSLVAHGNISREAPSALNHIEL
jgi:hypothetical protein